MDEEQCVPFVFELTGVEDELNLNDYQAFVVVLLQGNPQNEYIARVPIRKLSDGRIYTDALLLSKPFAHHADHVLDRLFIASKDNPMQVVFATASKSSPYAHFVAEDDCVPMPLPFDEQLSSLEKTVIPLTLLSAKQEPDSESGLMYWGIDAMRLTEISYTVNLSADPCGGSTRDIVWQSDLIVIKRNQQSGEQVIVEKSRSHRGQVGTLSFIDEKSVRNANELHSLYWFIPSIDAPRLVLTAELTIAQLNNYRQSGYWEVPLGADKGAGILDIDLYQSDLGRVGRLTPRHETDHPWDIRILSPWSCLQSASCTNQASPFADWQQLEPTDESTDLCGWISGGFERQEEGLHALAGYLKSPVYVLQSGRQVRITFDTAVDLEEIVQMRFVDIDLQTALQQSVQQQPIVRQADSQTWLFDILESGSYQLEIAVGGMIGINYKGVTITNLEYR